MTSARRGDRPSVRTLLIGMLAVFAAGTAAILLLGGAMRGPGGPEAPAIEPAPDGTPEVPLPSLVGTIGDSLTRAAAADGQPGDAPEHSWAVGTDPDDDVDSHLERLRRLGADPMVADAAISGARVETAPSQAADIVATAGELEPGEIAYVTFQLGANDLCTWSPREVTAPEAYESSVREAFDVLRRGLPEGSVLLVLSVPDVPRLAEIFPAESQARQIHLRFGICPVALGAGADLEAARDRIAAYNRILVRLCDELDGSGLDCRHDQAGHLTESLFGAPFEEGEVSDLDYFHPSIAGQARIAEETWPLTPWADR